MAELYSVFMETCGPKYSYARTEDNVKVADCAKWDALSPDEKRPWQEAYRIYMIAREKKEALVSVTAFLVHGAASRGYNSAKEPLPPWEDLDSIQQAKWRAVAAWVNTRTAHK